MIWIANLLVALVAILHVHFLILEIFLWLRPLGLNTFRNSIEKAASLALILLWLAQVPKERSGRHFLQCHTPSSTLALAMAPGAAGQDHRQKREEVAI
jgi:hypothetical protein